MPSGWAHNFYWVDQSTVVAPPVVSKGGGYPMWQAGPISVAGSLFGGLQGLWDRFMWWFQLYIRLKSWHPEQVHAALDRWETSSQAPDGVVERVHALLNHSAYPSAQAAVRRTATTLGFNRPDAWQGLSRQMKSSPGRAENVYRHLQACEWTREGSPSTLTNPECNLLVELAYHDFAAKGR